MRLNTKAALITILLFTCTFLSYSANRKPVGLIVVSGRVLDAESKEGIPFAILHFTDLNFSTTSDGDGNFYFNTDDAAQVRLKVSYLGYQSIDTTVAVKASDNAKLSISLRPLDFSLNEVVVSAKENVGGNSTSRIEKTAIEHIQASSFNDVLQLLPGNLTKDPNMDQVNSIAMRQAGKDNNTSLGTSFLIDGMPMSNDGNMQQTKYITSLGAESLVSTSKGVDMRTIATDRIESVEIVRGIPSVKHGDLTAGVVKIELKAGKTPWEGRLKADLSNKLFSVGKGFKLPDNNGLLNFDLDYINFNPDPRTDLTSYKRVTSSGRYQNNFRLSPGLDFIFKANLNYTGSFDNVKKDQDVMKGREDFTKSSYNNISVSSTGKLQLKKSFFREVNYGTSFSYTQDQLERQHLMSQAGVMPLSIAMEEGTFYASYLPNQYDSYLKIDGQPVFFNANVDASFDLNLGRLNQDFLVGTEFRYNKNIGKGQLYDINFPPYSSMNGSRPRPFDDVPALKKYSVYAQDELKLSVDGWKFNAQAGIRGTTLLGLSEQFAMNGRLYWEPRLNAKITLPPFSVFNYPASFALTGGVGNLYKFPTQAQLSPDKNYFDYIRLNYYSQNPDLRTLNIQTEIENPVNYQIQPALNTKYEVGTTVVVGKTTLNVTLFQENMDNGFSGNQQYTFHHYKRYDASSVDPSTITQRPVVEDFTSINDTASVVYGMTGNSAGVYKKGVEYTLDFGKIQPLYTSIKLNGAWFSTEYESNTQRLYAPSRIINDKTYPYIGIYDYSQQGNDKVQSQFNTNLNLDTHIPKLRMVFTTSLQTMWFEKSTVDWNSGLPHTYIDKSGQMQPFTEADKTDPVLIHLLDTNVPGYFNTNKKDVAMTLNLRLTKEIGDKLKMSFYVNRILSYLPNYVNNHGVTVNRSNLGDARPYFGAEINIKL